MQDTPPTPPSPGTPPPGSTPPSPGTPPPASPPPTQGDSQNKTIMLILAYLGILALIPLLVEKDDQEVQWHAKYGLVLLVAWIVVAIALAILTGIPGVGWIFGCAVGPLLWIVILVVQIVAMIKALQGGKLRLPVLADFADKWK